MKTMCWRSHIKTPFTFWDMHTWDMYLRNCQTSQENNSRILRIRNAKFSGYCFYMSANIRRDFQICISVPLNAKMSKYWKKTAFWCFGFSSHFSILLLLYLELWCKQMYAVPRITQHAHSCAILEMFDYDWSKLVICLSIDGIINTSTWRIRNQYY